MVFADDFSGSTLNESIWTIDLGAGDSRVRNSQGTADNVYLEDGALVLRSQREVKGKWNYTSGAVQTMGKVSWKHPAGTRACVRAKLPGGQGKAGPPPTPPPGWCEDTPCGSCRTGCQVGNSSCAGRICPTGTCNRCQCNRDGTPCGGSDKKRPDSQGVWPAHWMMPDNKACWPSNGEIVRVHTILFSSRTRSLHVQVQASTDSESLTRASATGHNGDGKWRRNYPRNLSCKQPQH